MTRIVGLIALVCSLALGLSGCTKYQGWTRYECQEYENWDAPECNPPQCEAQGICTKDILGEEITNATQTSK